MLLEMPPRDPGQPLPEIGTVTKAASSALEPSRQDRVSPYRSPSAATLEQLNIALANSPTRHQDQVKAKSSSPTLQRLLEGTMPLKKDSSEERATPSFSSSFSFIPAEEIKQEVEQVVSTPSVKTPQTVMLPTVSSPRKVPTEVAAQSAVAQAPPIEPKPEILELVASGESQASSRTEVQPSRVPVAETEGNHFLYILTEICVCFCGSRSHSKLCCNPFSACRNKRRKARTLTARTDSVAA